jgi:hypothetical protein
MEQGRSQERIHEVRFGKNRCPSPAVINRWKLIGWEKHGVLFNTRKYSRQWGIERFIPDGR